MRLIDDIKVIDNFISPSYLTEINQAVDPKSTHWRFNGIQTFSDRSGSLEDFGFSILLCSHNQPNQFYDTKLSTFIRPLVYKIKDYVGASTIIRSRLDLTILHKQKYIHPPHLDIQCGENKYVSAIFYINDTDGETIIYDNKYDIEPPSFPTNMKIKKTIKPKPGRLLLFDARYAHTGCSPSKHQTRILLNTVLL